MKAFGQGFKGVVLGLGFRALRSSDSKGVRASCDKDGKHRLITDRPKPEGYIGYCP